MFSKAEPHRVVHIVNKRGRALCPSYNFSDESWLDNDHNSWINFEDGRWLGEDNGFASDERRHSYTKSPPTRTEGGPQPSYGRDDLRHQLNSRKVRRPHHHHHHQQQQHRGSTQRTGSSKNNRTSVGDAAEPLSMPTGGARLVYTRDELLDLRDTPGGETPEIPVELRRGWGTLRDPTTREERDHRAAPAVVVKREPSPIDISFSSKRIKSSSPEEDTGPTPKQEESNGWSLNAAAIIAKEAEPSQESLHPPGNAPLFKVKEEVMEEELKFTSDNFTSRRSDAIKAKAVEIEKNYRQDCEIFRMVVKMLVSKEPDLDGRLQTSLDKILEQLKRRCLDALRSFVSELDEILEQPHALA